jgi:hypothetical protein
MRIFISHASEDKKIAEAIHFALTGAGHKTFFDSADLSPSTDYHERIRKSIRKSDAFVFLVSPDSITEGSYALTELKFARSKWRHPEGHIIPVMVRKAALADIPVYLKSVTYLEPEGNIAAEVADVVSKLSEKRKIGLVFPLILAIAIPVATLSYFILNKTPYLNPQIEVSSPHAVFSPDNDGINDTLIVKQTSNDQPSWEGSFIDKNSEVVKKLTWNGKAVDFEWDGKDEKGRPLPNGYYTYRISSNTKQSNNITKELKHIEINAKQAPIPTSQPTSVPSPVSVSNPTAVPDPGLRLDLVIKPVPFSPNNDGIDDEVNIMPIVKGSGEIKKWGIVIRDPGGISFIKYSGDGKPQSIVWNGVSAIGKRVESGCDYAVSFIAQDGSGNSTSVERVISADVMFDRKGTNLTTGISSISFKEGTADYTEVDPEKYKHNKLIFSRLAEICMKYDSYNIDIVNFMSPLIKTASAEPSSLSIDRAEAVGHALVSMGLKPSRIKTKGVYGINQEIPERDRASYNRVDIGLIRN